MNRECYSHRDVIRYAKVCPILFPIVIALSYVLYTHFDMEGNFPLLVIWIGWMTIIGTILPIYLSCRRKKKLTVSNKRLFGMETREYYKQIVPSAETEGSLFGDLIPEETLYKKLKDDAETNLSPEIPKYQEEYISAEFMATMSQSMQNKKHIVNVKPINL